MGLDVELFRIEQEGTSSRRRRTVEITAVGDTRFRFAEAVGRAQHTGSTPMLDRADRYGMLELAGDEMPQLLGELAQLLAAATTDQEREVLVAVRGLAERCRSGPDLGLRFVGD